MNGLSDHKVNHAPTSFRDLLVEMAQICKSFPGVRALDEVSLKIERGTVHALVGENGAGKSTLMKILTGVYLPDRGSVKVEGRKIEIRKPIDLLRAGISMIHQEFNLISRHDGERKYILWPRSLLAVRSILGQAAAALHDKRRSRGDRDRPLA